MEAKHALKYTQICKYSDRLYIFLVLFPALLTRSRHSFVTIIRNAHGHLCSIHTVHIPFWSAASAKAAAYQHQFGYRVCPHKWRSCVWLKETWWWATTRKEEKKFWFHSLQDAEVAAPKTCSELTTWTWIFASLMQVCLHFVCTGFWPLNFYLQNEVSHWRTAITVSTYTSVMWVLETEHNVHET